EALAAARPVVATRIGGTPDLLGDGRRGLLVPPGDPGALAAGILDALRRSEPVLARAREGQAYVLAHHSSRRLVDDVDSLYRELLSRPAAAACRPDGPCPAGGARHDGDDGAVRPARPAQPGPRPPRRC